MENLFNSFNSNKYIIKKSIAELRSGIPVLLYNHESNLLVFPSELINRQVLHQIQKYSERAYILLTGNRLNFILQSSGNQLSRITIKESYTIDYISFLLLGQELHNTFNLIDISTIISTNSLDKTAISLIKLTKLLPSAIVIDINHHDILQWCKEHNITPIKQEIIDNYNQEYELEEVCNSPLFLKNCCDANVSASINIYRSNIGEPETLCTYYRRTRL